MDATTLFVGLILSSIGMGYIVYGRKQRETDSFGLRFGPVRNTLRHIKHTSPRYHGYSLNSFAVSR